MKTHGPEYEAWLAQLKVGDTWKAIQPHQWHHGSIVTLTITGETNKQWKFGAAAYWKSNGHMVGGRYDCLLPPATEDELADLRTKIKLSNLRTKLHNVRWQDVSLATLTAIDAILNPSKETTA